MGMWINSLLPIKVFQAVILILAMAMFSHGLPKKDHYWIRLALWGVLCVLTAAGIPLLTEGLPH